MAVFPTARRALSRPSRLPWLIAAVALLTAFAAPYAAHLLDAPRRAELLPAFIASEDARSTQTGSLTGEDGRWGDAVAEPIKAASASSTAQLIAPDTSAREAVFSATVLAFEAEAYVGILESAMAETQAIATIAEVSEEPVRVVVEPVAETAVATSTPGEAASAAPTTVAPATEAQPPVEVAPPAPVVAPVQAAPVSAAGPVERWAAAGVVIATAGQDLDDASLANLDAALSVLPPGVVSNLGNPAFGPLHILVNTKGRVLSGDQPYGGPANFFSTNEATNELVLYPQQSVFTVVHELGHAYNLRRIAAGRYAMVLLDPEMRSFLTATGWRITSTDAEIRSAIDHMHVDYAYTGSFHWPRLSNDDPLEDFANSFAMYFLDPGGLQQMSPERYAWMAGTFGR